MAPIKLQSGSTKGKSAAKSKSKSRPSSKSKKSNSALKPSQVKTKPAPAPPKKKQKVYTDKELGIPQLNMITPAGVQKPKGKRKGKVFVDDQESMMTILAMVNADKEGQIESKMMKARQMEEIREARRREAEARQEQKRSKLEETKDALRKRRKRKLDTTIPEAADDAKALKPSKPGKKRVSFG